MSADRHFDDPAVRHEFPHLSGGQVGLGLTFEALPWSSSAFEDAALP